MSDQLAYQAQIFSNRLKKRWKHLGKWARKNDISCFRLYDRDIPEVPVIVDLYERYLHITEFHSPHKNLPGTSEQYEEVIKESARRAVGVEPEDVFFKMRRKTGRSEQYEKQGEHHRTAVVSEGGLRFEINLSDYLDTGLFLDHRQTRAMMRELVQDLASSTPVRVLNLFSYTGAFTVYAASGGAFQTISVDMSNTYTAWAQKNLELNGLDNEHHVFVCDDAFRFLETPDLRPYDLVILDPPTFSNGKKMYRDLDTQRDHVELIHAAAKSIKRGGFLLFSTNRKRFKLNERALDGFAVTDITGQTIPPDFRDRRIHHCWILEKRF